MDVFTRAIEEAKIKFEKQNEVRKKKEEEEKKKTQAEIEERTLMLKQKYLGGATEEEMDELAIQEAMLQYDIDRERREQALIDEFRAHQKEKNERLKTGEIPEEYDEEGEEEGEEEREAEADRCEDLPSTAENLGQTTNTKSNFEMDETLGDLFVRQRDEGQEQPQRECQTNPISPKKKHNFNFSMPTTDPSTKAGTSQDHKEDAEEVTQFMFQRCPPSEDQSPLMTQTSKHQTQQSAVSIYDNFDKRGLAIKKAEEMLAKAGVPVSRKGFSSHQVATEPIGKEAKAGDLRKTESQDFFNQTDLVTTNTCFNRISDASSGVQNQTAPGRFSMGEQGTKGLALSKEDPVQNNFIHSQVNFAPVEEEEDNKTSASPQPRKQLRQEDASIEQTPPQNFKFDSVADDLCSYEKKRMLQIEKQQNELQLRILQLQSQLQSKKDPSSMEETDAPPTERSDRTDLTEAQEFGSTIKKEADRKHQEEVRMSIIKKKELQSEQEELIQSIVLKSAVFEKDVREAVTKEEDIQEELIQSINNKSGVFVREFRKIEDDPYAREEFIMSIGRRSANFQKVDFELEGSTQFQQTMKSINDNPFEVAPNRRATDTIGSKKKEGTAAQILYQELTSKEEAPPGEQLPKTENRKQKIIYEMEVDTQIRKIKKNQQKQKAQEGKQRIELGQNLLAQIMGKNPQEQQPPTKFKSPAANLPVLNEQDSFGQQEKDGIEEDDIEDEIEEREDSDEAGNIFQSRGETSEDILLDSLARPANDEIEVSTGTFGKVREQIDLLSKQASSTKNQEQNSAREVKKSRVLSAVPKKQSEECKPPLDRISRPISGVHRRGQGSAREDFVTEPSNKLGSSKISGFTGLDVRSGFTSSDDPKGSSLNQRSEGESGCFLSGRDITESEVDVDLVKNPADPSLLVLNDLDKEESYDFDQYAKSKAKSSEKGPKSAIGQSEGMSEDIARADDSLNSSETSGDRLQQLMVDTGQIPEEENKLTLSQSRDPTNANMDDIDQDRSDLDSFADSKTENQLTIGMRTSEAKDPEPLPEIPEMPENRIKTAAVDRPTSGRLGKVDEEEEFVNAMSESRDETETSKSGSLYYENERYNNMARSSQASESMVSNLRPITAPTNKLRPQTGETNDPPETPKKSIMSSQMADNSVVNMGQITIDRKNHLLGNQFQSPEKNVHPEEVKMSQELKAVFKKQLDLIHNKLSSDQFNDQDPVAQAELIELQRQNEIILKKLLQQKRLRETIKEESGGDNEQLLQQEQPKIIDEQKAEQSRPVTRSGRQSKPTDEKIEEEDYEEDTFDQHHSDDDRAVDEMRKAYDSAVDQSLLGSKSMLKLMRTTEQSPEASGKKKEPGLKERSEAHYDDVEESMKLKERQEEMDPLRQFYEQEDEEFAEAKRISIDAAEKARKKRKAWGRAQTDILENEKNGIIESGSEEAVEEEGKRHATEQPELKPKQQHSYVMDFNEDLGDTAKATKMRRFEEFKQRREQQEEERKLKAKQQRLSSRNSGRKEYQEPSAGSIEMFTAEEPPQSEIIKGTKVKASDLVNHPTRSNIPPKPARPADVKPSFKPPQGVNPTRTPLQKQHQPKGFRGVLPSPGRAIDGNSHHQSSQLRLQRDPSNGIRKSGSTVGSARNSSGQRNFYVNASQHGSRMESIGYDEESKYDIEAQFEGDRGQVTKLPPLGTPSAMSNKSKQTPSIQPRKPMQKMSNKKLIRNAICQVVMAGQNPQTRRDREELLAVLDTTDFSQYLILFKGQSESFHFRALYAAVGGGDTEEERSLQLIFGQASKLSPAVIEEAQMERFFKYSSGSKSFQELGGQRSLTLTTDAVMLKKPRKMIV